MNRKNISLLSLCIILIVCILGVSPAGAAGSPLKYYWHTFMGGAELDEARAMELDAAGNILVAGISLDAWDGPSGQSPVNAFYADQEITVAKTSKTGAYLWHTFHGAGGLDDVYDMAVSPDGKIAVTGFSQLAWKGPGDIDPKHAHSGAYDIFVLCLAADGSYLWHTFYGTSTNFNEIGLAVTWDATGNVVVSGMTDDSWQGPGTPAADPLHGFTGDNDLFVLKLGGDGAYQWHTFYGSSAFDDARGVTTDPDGNIYVTGVSRESWTGPLAESPLNNHAGGGNEDVLLMRLSPAGTYAWHAFYGSSSIDRGNDVALDQSGNLYLSGESAESWDFPYGPTPPLHAYNGGLDILVMKLVPAPTSVAYVWHTFHGSGDNDSGRRLSVGTAGLVVGGFSGGSWNGPSGEGALNAYAGSNDIVGLGLTTNGAYQWHAFFGSNLADKGFGVAVDANGNITLAGSSAGSWTGPGGVAPKSPYTSSLDMVIVKMITTQSKTIASSGAQDGWILERGENANAGGTMNAGAIVLRVGDDAARKQYRSILSFPTGAALPDTAILTKVTLRVRRQGIVGGLNPVTTFQGFMLDIRKGPFGIPSLQLTDWQAPTAKTIGPLNTPISAGWYVFNLTGARAYINKLASGAGVTQIRMRFKLDDNNNALANYLSLYSGNTGALRARS